MPESLSAKKIISLHDGSNAEILSGPEVKQLLDIDTKRRLLETYMLEESRNSLYGVLGKPTISTIAEENMQFDIERLDKIIETNNLFILKVDGKIAGMIGFIEIGKLPEDGRPVYMGTRLIVLPEFRGQKLGIQLMDYAHISFRDRFPDTPLLSVTRNNFIKNKRREDKSYEEIGEAASMVISGQQEYLEAHKAELDRRRDEEGWTAFLSDPKKFKQPK
jgi:hypothetical protein